MQKRKNSKKAEVVVASILCSAIVISSFNGTTRKVEAHYEQPSSIESNAEQIVYEKQEKIDLDFLLGAPLCESEAEICKITDFDTFDRYDFDEILSSQSSGVSGLYKFIDMPEDYEQIEKNEIVEQPEVIVKDPRKLEGFENIAFAKDDCFIDLEDLKISFDMDLTERSGLSKGDFITLIERCPYDYNGFFKENSELIYDLCKEYQINEVFFVGLIAAESGWEIQPYHVYTNNYISMMGGGGMLMYESKEVGLTEAAKLLHNEYLTEGGSCYCGATISGVKQHFCPGSPTWEGLLYGCMQYVVQ